MFSAGLLCEPHMRATFALTECQVQRLGIYNMCVCVCVSEQQTDLPQTPDTSVIVCCWA